MSRESCLLYFRLATIIVLGHALLAFVTSASGRDIYVDNVSGDDRNNGAKAEPGSIEAGPLRTIARALWIAHPGDRIVLVKNDEPYREMVCLIGPRNSGTEEEPFIIEGNGAVIDGTAPVPEESWEHAAGDVFQVRLRYMAHPMLFEAGKTLPRVRIANEAELDKLQVGEWASLKGKVYFRPAADRSLLSYPLSGASLATGITLFQVQHVVIRNLTVQGFRIDGVAAPDAAEVVRLERVISRANGRSGLSVGGASRVIAHDSQFLENGVTPVRIEGFSKLRIVNSVLSPDGEIDRRGGTLLLE